MRSTFPKCASHVQHSRPAERLRRRSGNRLPVLAVTASDGDVAVEMVGIRKQHRCLSAINLKQRTRKRRVEREDGLGGLAGFELGKGTHMAGYGDVELFSRLGPRANHPPFLRLRPKRSDRGNRSEDLYQHGEVIRPKVEERASTSRIQERRIGMPRLWSWQLQQRQSRERRPDQALLDKPAGGLESRSQKGVWGAANEQPGRLSVAEQALTADSIQGQRLFVPDVFASPDRPSRYLRMSRR